MIVEIRDVRRRRSAARRSGIVAIGLAFAAASCSSSQTPGRAAEEGARQLEEIAGAFPSGVIRGNDGWLFLSSELLAMAAALRGAEATQPGELPDALARRAAIVSRFSELVKGLGAHFLFVTIPPKAAIYPEMVPLPSFLATASTAAQAAFLDRLRSTGVDVLDLSLPLIGERRGGEVLFCRQDTHWTSFACWKSAQAIAFRLRDKGAWTLSPLSSRVPERGTSTPRGDLWQLLEEPRPPQEEVRLFLAPRPPEWTTRPPSPVLVLGDSFSLRYRPREAGLVDHLERELGAPIDLIAAEAGAGTQVRQSLARTPGLLRGKQLVIWVLSTRLIYGGPEWQEVAIAPE